MSGVAHFGNTHNMHSSSAENAEMVQHDGAGPVQALY